MTGEERSASVIKLGNGEDLFRTVGNQLVTFVVTETHRIVALCSKQGAFFDHQHFLASIDERVSNRRAAPTAADD